MIRFQCHNCETKLKVNDDRAGRTVICPKCNTPIKVESFVEAVAVETTPKISPPLPQIVQRQTQPHTTQQTQPWMIPVIILSTLFCFPVGIVLIWIQSAWTHNQKIYWTAGIVGVPMLIVLILPAIQAVTGTVVIPHEEQVGQQEEKQEKFEEQTDKEFEERMEKREREKREMEMAELLQRNWNKKIRSEESDRRERLGISPW